MHSDWCGGLKPPPAPVDHFAGSDYDDQKHGHYFDRAPATLTPDEEAAHTARFKTANPRASKLIDTLAHQPNNPDPTSHYDPSLQIEFGASRHHFKASSKPLIFPHYKPDTKKP